MKTKLLSAVIVLSAICYLPCALFAQASGDPISAIRYNGVDRIQQWRDSIAVTKSLSLHQQTLYGLGTIQTGAPTFVPFTQFNGGLAVTSSYLYLGALGSVEGTAIFDDALNLYGDTLTAVSPLTLGRHLYLPNESGLLTTWTDTAHAYGNLATQSYALGQANLVIADTSAWALNFARLSGTNIWTAANTFSQGHVNIGFPSVSNGGAYLYSAGDAYYAELTQQGLTVNRTAYLPNLSGVVLLDADTSLFLATYAYVAAHGGSVPADVARRDSANTFTQGNEFKTVTQFDSILSFRDASVAYGQMQYNKVNAHGFTMMGDTTGSLGIGEGVDDGTPNHFFRGGGFGATGNHYSGSAVCGAGGADVWITGGDLDLIAMDEDHNNEHVFLDVNKAGQSISIGKNQEVLVQSNLGDVQLLPPGSDCGTHVVGQYSVLGDFAGVRNSTQLQINDGTQNFNFYTDNGSGAVLVADIDGTGDFYSVSGSFGIGASIVLNATTLGSGVVNSSLTTVGSPLTIGTNTLTMGGNVTFSGAHNMQFTVPGAYTYTLPSATSTLTAAGVTSVANKTTSASTTSTSAYKMAGLGSNWAITPAKYTSIMVTVDGQAYNTTTADSISIQIAYGTGTAPSAGASVTGTVAGSTTTFQSLTGLLTAGVPFSKTYIITGLTAGTAYWIDLQLEAGTGGTAIVRNLEYTARELQY